MAKAKLVYTIRDRNGYGKTAFYKYRGHEYIIHFCNNGCMDDMNIARIHKEEQARIDYKIEHPESTEIKPYSGPSLDDIFNLMDIDT